MPFCAKLCCVLSAVTRCPVTVGSVCLCMWCATLISSSVLVVRRCQTDKPFHWSWQDYLMVYGAHIHAKKADRLGLTYCKLYVTVLIQGWCTLHCDTVLPFIKNLNFSIIFCLFKVKTLWVAKLDIFVCFMLFFCLNGWHLNTVILLSVLWALFVCDNARMFWHQQTKWQWDSVGCW